MSTRDVYIDKTPLELDILVIGAGFGGLYQLHNYRKLGYKVHLLESGSDIGGIWYWNCYPGARVDSPVPVYEYSMEDLWKEWNWTEQFPGWEELRAYFRFVDEKLGLKKDITFNARVVRAEWSEGDHWTVSTANELVIHSRFLVLALGFAAKRYTPPFPNLDSYQGICHHTSAWPETFTPAHFAEKRTAVIGTGASGVQIIQEVGPILGEEGHLTVFQRTPNYCLPMRQKKFTVDAQNEAKKIYPTIYKRRYQTYGGFIYGAYHKGWSSATPEERILRLEELWAKGSLEIITSNYVDLRRNQEANDAVYAFWRDKVRSRIRDTRLQEKLAPTVPPHPFGAKRAALEETYYEVYNQPNVSLIDVNENPIARFTPQGIVTQDGNEHKFDIVVLATGFDSVTGGITQIDIRGTDGRSIKEKWKNGIFTNLGMTAAGFPNMFFVYGPQGPTAFCNGPSCSEMQGDWIIRCIQYMKTHDLTRIEATHEAEIEYKEYVLEAYEAMRLMKEAKSWWNGGNIPGKVVEPLSFAGGLPSYLKRCWEKEQRGYEGFILSSETSRARL
ncbi:hypothetical protein E1B28_012739 [Marasmius oreades]|uniref:FAD/NAD(P)-binding domain-containing protein n=1 Tax=Marasmius oreades TaxID=181124 RepID=A0A9P7UP06_9AGAR|nr:uncharacterized protein E1B28_012739 [Marasmius oreades]KAG7088773.1 hypothetical protein E1B28_012739 [Marasmius oreades]